MAEKKVRKRKPKSERQSYKPTLDKLGDALKEVLKDITEELYADVDRGLDKAARYTEEKLENATPIGNGKERGKTKASWVVDFKYTNVRYINNVNTRPGDSSRGEGENVPIVNLLEFGSKGKPFVRKTIEAEQQNIINIIKGEIENGKT